MDTQRRHAVCRGSNTTLDSAFTALDSTDDTVNAPFNTLDAPI